MAKTKEELLAECNDLRIDTEGLTTNALLKDAIDAKKEELENLNVDPEQTEGILSFKIQDSTYTFSDRCPDKLQVNNKVYKKAELLNHEDVLTFLVVGNSPFIQKL